MPMLPMLKDAESKKQNQLFMGKSLVGFLEKSG